MLSTSARDALRVLDVSGGATPDEIKNAYRIMALKYHPDRQHNIHNKDAASRCFLEVANAYRTLVREGHVNYRNTPMSKTRLESPTPPPPVRRPMSLQHRNSSESSMSVDSFVHMVASSTETLNTPTSSKGESLRSAKWKQGVLNPADTVSAQHRNSTQPYLYHYELPPLRNTAKPWQVYSAPPSYAPTSSQPQLTKEFPQLPISSKVPAGSLTSARDMYPSSARPRSVSSPAKTNMRPLVRPTKPRMNSKESGSSQKPSSITEQPDVSTLIPPYAIPLLSIGPVHPGEWAYSLSLTLEELFVGKHFRFGISRSYLSKKSKNVVIEIDIPAGCRAGTKIMCRNVGHEWKQGAYQDIAFVIEEVPHDRFVRMADDLIMEVRLPWVDSLRRQGGKVPFIGIDGRKLGIQIDYPGDKNMKGRSVIQGAGMPIRERGQAMARGNLIVQWEILPPTTKILHFMRRLWGKK